MQGSVKNALLLFILTTKLAKVAILQVTQNIASHVVAPILNVWPVMKISYCRMAPANNVRVKKQVVKHAQIAGARPAYKDIYLINKKAHVRDVAQLFQVALSVQIIPNV